ncbi:MAG: hypothetical protein QG675_463 [Patescibacteria group bacterium]|jgi:hypothetical protein|nr:hypothetical protein [Patescibacteria group bacterium]
MLEFFTNNWQGIVLATVASMAIGTLWYSKLMFGVQWQKLAKLKAKDMKKGMPKAMLVMLVMAFVSAFVLQRFLVISNPEDILSAIKVAIWLWLGFVLTYTLGNVVFEKRPLQLAVINLGNQLITLCVMAAILYSF